VSMLYGSGVARSTLDAMSLLLLATAIGSTLILRTDAFVRLLALQGVLLAAAAGAVVLAFPSLHGVSAVAITALVKAVAVPLTFRYALRRVGRAGGAEVVLSRKLTFVLAVALVLLAFYVTRPLAYAAGDLAPNALPTAVSLILLGLLTMATRRKALAQVAGLVILENGLYLTALAVTRGLPLAVELGVAVDILVGVLVMGLVAQQIERTFATIDTDRLRALRG
jgi:hydrogenase-4 component E